MPNEGTGLAGEAKWLVVPLVLAVVCSVWALVSWERFRRTRTALVRRGQDISLIVEPAEELLALRAALGESGPSSDPSSGQDLIPFLESAAVRAGISKEALSINTESPKPIPGRRGVTSQETRVGVKEASVQSLVRFLATAERGFAGLEIRELVLSPLAEDQGWSAHALVAVTMRKGAEE